MCKHILIRQYEPKNDSELLKEFCRLTYDNDGYGAIIRTDENAILTLKSLNVGSFYFDLSSLLSKVNVIDLVVHHRTSTNKKGLEYAHPFEFQGNYLTHNGVVSVPDQHDTLTENDSEYLLHHLIKTEFNTQTISGYFSCFILNQDTTTILVDNTAPMYQLNNRVYSSHNLFESMQKVTLSKIDHFIIDERIIETPIQVTASSYGMNKASLSLGWNDSDRYTPSKNYYFDSVDAFFSMLSYNDENEILYFCDNSKERKDYIKKLAIQFDLKLTKNEIGLILGEMQRMTA